MAATAAYNGGMLNEIIRQTWQIAREAAPFILFGFIMAGLVKSLLPEGLVTRYLRKRNLRSVFHAALLGVPLPLCSCGVLPAAAALHRKGASRGATVSFLISTPESGVDSIAATWALMDPVMTVFRPLAALVTAAVAGIGENLFGKKGVEEAPPPPNGEAVPPLPFGQRAAQGIAYAFNDLLDDMAKWLAGGLLIAGVIAAVLPDGFFTAAGRHELLSMFVMLGVGIPLYICATASTPIAAALLLKGLSPGAALVFLLAGPATNPASLAVVGKMLGRRSLAIYLGAIALCAVGMGLLLNRLYEWMGIAPAALAGGASAALPPVLEDAAGILLAGLLVRGIWREYRKKNAPPPPAPSVPGGLGRF